MKLSIPLILLAFVLIAAIRWDDTPRHADIVMINRGEVFTLDPQRMSYLQDFRIAYAIYEGLLRWNNDDFSIAPAAAANLPEISADHLTITFHLRADATWSNGDPVTAADFVYSWQRLLWPDTAADYSNLFFVIDGAETFFKWRNAQLAAFAAEAKGMDDANRLARAESLLIEAQLHFSRTVGLKATDARTLQVRLKQPCPYFLDLVCLAVACPVHRPSVEGWPLTWKDDSAPPMAQRQWQRLDLVTGRIEQEFGWTKPGILVSNGPYILAQWRYKRDMRLEPNPRYHSPELLRNRSVLCTSVEDNNTAVLAYESGEADWLADVNAEYLPDMLAEQQRYEDRYRSELDRMHAEGKSHDEALALLPLPRADLGERRNIHPMPTYGTEFIQFNCRPELGDGSKNPFADARVRRAFALCIDKREIVRSVTRLNEPVINALIPPDSIPGYHTPTGLGFNRFQARDELIAAGWDSQGGDGLLRNARGEAFPAVEILYSTRTPRYQWLMLNLRDQWQAALGVRVELRAADPKFFGDSLQHGKFMISHGRWYGDYGDPTTFLDIFRTGDGNNDRGYSNPRIDAMLDHAANETDPASRMKALEECERIICAEELPLVPICQLVQAYMYEPGKLKGLTSHPRLVQYLWEMEAAK